MNYNPLSQRDSRWANTLLGDSNTSTIGGYGCTITCITVMYNAYAGTNLTPADVNSRMKDEGAFQNDLVLWDKVGKALPGLKFEWRGYNYENDKVAANLPCLVQVDFDGRIATPNDKHWVLYIGNKRMVDPWTGHEIDTSKYPIATGYAIFSFKNPDQPIQTGEPLLEILTSNGIDTEGELREVIGHHKDFPFLQLDKENAQKRIKELEEILRDIEDQMDDIKSDLSATKTSEKQLRKDYEEFMNELIEKLKPLSGGNDEAAIYGEIDRLTRTEDNGEGLKIELKAAYARINTLESQLADKPQIPMDQLPNIWQIFKLLLFKHTRG